LPTLKRSEFFLDTPCIQEYPSNGVFCDSIEARAKDLQQKRRVNYLHRGSERLA
jgi:hypothetical protein